MLFSRLAGEDWKKEHDDFDVTGICYDSRNVEKGNVFVAIKGLVQDGHKYAKMAEEKGAAVIVAEDKVDVNIPVFYVENTKRTIAEMSAEFFGNPSGKFKLIGVTGTNGKTTTTYLIKSIFEAAGKRVGIIGTNQNIIGDKVLITQSTTPTTPNALELQKLFAEMAEGGAEYVVMEVSSHALELDRVYGCDFDTCIFTNLTRDHLDFHKTMERYYEAKAKLFTMCGTAVINIDDESGKRIAESAECKKVTVSINEPSDMRGRNISVSAEGI
ncbi:MAG: UDP-N-acetylmuramyl-tripeptide synthetase, partial [Oscillospiraceae bacterium]|nr:UDP-N-acetylmuramyl-tripeptide synthetase [Oscillospiraceae bacterium]